MVTIRKIPLVTDQVYHIFNKSIAGYEIFNNQKEFSRMIEAIHYYQWGVRKMRFSEWEETKKDHLSERLSPKEDKVAEIIAYCVMPTHIHLILKQMRDKGISIFMSQISNSYARYFNLRHKRKGPLWEKEFENVIITTDEQLLHLTRYIHLNPVSVFLVNKPENWLFSSYREYSGEVKESQKICNYTFLDINPLSYRKFVEDRIAYQRELEKIKNLILD